MSSDAVDDVAAPPRRRSACSSGMMFPKGSGSAPAAPATSSSATGPAEERPGVLESSPANSSPPVEASPEPATADLSKGGCSPGGSRRCAASRQEAAQASPPPPSYSAPTSLAPQAVGTSSSAGQAVLSASRVADRPALEAAATASRRPLDAGMIERALELAAKSSEIERDGTVGWPDCPWDRAVCLRPSLELAARTEFAPPPRFHPAMETCMTCLLHVPEGRLGQPRRLLALLESPEYVQLLRYLTWLETAVQEVSPSSSSSGTSCRTVLVPQRVRSALCSWSAERALLQQSAAALCEALITHAPEHHRRLSDWEQSMKSREAIQLHQEEDCQRLVRELEGAVAFLAERVQEGSGGEWPALARTTEASLWGIQQLTNDLLQSSQENWSTALEEYEALGVAVVSHKTAAGEARRQVRRHEQAFHQATQRFTEVANQLVAWTCVLVPKLQLLESFKSELRTVLELRRKLPLLERDYLAAEDDLDTAQTELRKHKRHAQASRTQRPMGSVELAAASIALERQIDQRIASATERVRQLTDEIRETEQRLKDLEAFLPVALEADDEDGGSAGGAGCPNEHKHREPLSNEERLALKLAKLEQFHEELVVEVAETQAQRDKVLRKVEKRKVAAALRRHMEPDFMCPILHERMRVPVLAADGFTYERQAIEKWLSMHNTSPMTGALLAHRYLTENFALRHLIDAYDAQVESKDGPKKKSDRKDGGKGRRSRRRCPTGEKEDGTGPTIDDVPGQGEEPFHATADPADAADAPEVAEEEGDEVEEDQVSSEDEEVDFDEAEEWELDEDVEEEFADGVDPWEEEDHQHIPLSH